MKKILGLVALVATLGLASCQKNEEVKIEQRQKSIEINLANLFTATKASQDGVLTNDKANLADINIFFVKSDGTFARGLDANEAEKEQFLSASDYLTAAGNLNVDSKIVFHYLPAEVNKVVVVGNWTKDRTKEFANYAALKAATENIINEDEVDDLTLYGEAKPVEQKTEIITGHTYYKADVQIKPIVSRLEIVGFEYTSNPDAADDVSVVDRKYKKITVEQVTLHNYYTDSSVGISDNTTLTGTSEFAPAITDINVFSFLQEKAKLTHTNLFDTDVLSGVELTEDVQWVKEYTEPVRATESVSAVAGDKRPAYNFFPYATDDVNYNAGVPQLVVKLTGVLKDADTDDKNDIKEALYLVTSDIKANGTTIAGKTYNQVYKMNFKFSDKDLENPLMCVQVTVEVLPWTAVEVVPEF